MTPFRNLSIRTQLILLILSVTTASLVAGLGFILVSDIALFKKDITESARLIAQVIGNWSIYDLKFQVREDSEKTLARLSGLQNVNIEQACLYDDQGRVFSSFGTAPGPMPFPALRQAGSLFQGDHLHVLHPIRDGARYVGSLYLCMSTRALNARIRGYLFTTAGLLGFLVMVSVVFAMNAQAVISRPILSLARAARRVSEEGDVSIRVEKKGGGEVAILCDGFNAMLDRIQEREKERDAAAQALKLSEDRLRHIIEQSNDALFVRVGLRFLFVNPRFEQYFEYQLKETSAPDFDFLNLVAPENRDYMRDRMGRQERGDTIIPQFNFKGVSKSGKVYDFEASVAEIAWDGQPATLGTLRDITQRVRAEEKLKRQQEQLRLYAQDLERSNRELEQFAYVASHDLQEPLRKVQAFGDRLKDKVGPLLGDQGADYLERMQNAARRMATLINDLLAYSRVTSRAQPFTAVDLNRVAEEVLSDLEVRIEQEGARVVVGDLPAVDADPLQMRQLLQNLIGNALKFHLHGAKAEVRVAARIVDHMPPAAGTNAVSGPFLSLTVKDNGIGFDEKYLDRIFTVFQRLHGRGEYEGTGIGLAICRKIAERHGGHITAESAPGKGAAFIVTLPLRQPKGGSA